MEEVRGGHGLRITLVILLLVLGLVSYGIKYPSSLYEKIVYGELIDSSLNSDGTVWILTDGTIKYNNSVNDVTKIGFFLCKTNLYLYDPIKKTVLKTITTRYDDLPPRMMGLFQENNKLWQIGPHTVFVYDSKTGEELQNTDTFVLNHKELSSGIANVNLSNYPNLFCIETKDARKLLYSIEENSILPNEENFLGEKVYQHYENKKVESILVLMQESPSNKSRQMLYHVKGTIPALVKYVIWFHPKCADLCNLNSAKGLVATPFSSKEIYLEPLIAYQDKEIAIIVSQKEVGEESDRVLTCVDSTGVKKWVVEQEQLLPDLKLTKENLIAKSWLEWALKGERMGNTFVLTFKHRGAMGVDVATGKMLWQVQLKNG